MAERIIHSVGVAGKESATRGAEDKPAPRIVPIKPAAPAPAPAAAAGVKKP
jgi:hypothetical protein